MKRVILGGIAALALATMVAFSVPSHADHTLSDMAKANAEALAQELWESSVVSDDPYAAACKAYCAPDPAWNCICTFSGGAETTLFGYNRK